MVLNCNLIVPAVATVISMMILPEFVVIPVPIQMIPTAVALVYIGCVMSRNKVIVEETLSRKDAALFPVTASCALFGLYICRKYFGKEMLNIVIGIYLCIIGTFCIADLLGGLIDYASDNKTKKEVFNLSFTIPYLGEVKLSLTYSDLMGGVVGAATVLGWYFSSNRLLHNAIACCLVVQGVAMMSLSNFKVAAVFLVGLFAYDIFWVFFTEVMVTVAVSVEAPIKLIFPVSLDPEAKKSILGLGDLVVPGAVIAMTHRLDCFLQRGELPAGKRVETVSSDPTVANTVTYKRPDSASPHYFSIGPYFASQMVAYAVGLLVTVVVMYIFAAAQPALFYLVPASLLTLVGMALYRGEQMKVWEYTEEDPEKKNEAKIVDQKTDEKENKTPSITSKDASESDEWNTVEKEDAYEDKKRK